MPGRVVLPAAALLILALASTPAQADMTLGDPGRDVDLPLPRTSSLTASVVGAAGSPGSSTTVVTNGTLAQSTPAGMASAPGLTLSAGFWSIVVRTVWPVGVPPPPELSDSLDPCYPNPFNPLTTIPYMVSARGLVRVEVYDLRGRRVRTLVDEVMPAGRHRIVWNGADDHGRAVASGPYVCRLRTGDFQAVQKLLMIK